MIAMTDLHDVLNRIRDEANLAFGLLNSEPRVNKGPCGMAAKIFREVWREMLGTDLIVVFLMKRCALSTGTVVPYCDHVLVRLPDGCLFDLGCGVMAARRGEIEDKATLEEMNVYDHKLMEDRSYGFTRTYRQCPDFDADRLRQIVRQGLMALSQDAAMTQAHARLTSPEPENSSAAF
jgi:hypothetical protein